MKLQKKLLFYFALPTLLLIAISYSYIYVEISDKFLHLEKDNAITNKERFEAYLIEDAKSLYATNSNTAQWDDTYRFIEKPSQKYIQNEILVEPFYDIKTNDVFIINLKGDILFTKNFDYNKKTYQETASDIVQAVTSKIILPIVFSQKQVAPYGISQFGDRLYIYTVANIKKSTGLGDHNGYLIFTKELNKEYLTRVSELLQTQVQILHNDHTHPNIQNNEVIFNNEDKQLFKMFYQATENLAENKSPLLIEITNTKEASLQYRNSLKQMGTLSVGSLCIAILLIYLFVHHDIIKKIIILSDKLNTLHQSARSKERLPVFGNDEISNLSREINHMLDELLKDQMRFNQTSRLSSLGEMAGSIAHEINNPMAIIHGNAYLIKSYAKTEPINAEEIHNLAEKIENTTKRISKIVKSLRAVARDGVNDPVDIIAVKDIIAEALNLCEAKLKNNKVFFSVSSFNSNLTIQTRPVQVIQALINLISNSQYAIAEQENKWIRIDVAEVGQNVLIKVIDSGFGIDPMIQEKIMQPFFTTKPVGQGTGLGLSISKSMIEANEGELYLDTKNNNTCFVIQIPKTQSANQTKKIP